MVTWETDTTVCPAYGDGAMLGSLFIVEAFSDTDREEGELVPEAEDPTVDRGQNSRNDKQHNPTDTNQIERFSKVILLT